MVCCSKEDRKYPADNEKVLLIDLKDLGSLAGTIFSKGDQLNCCKL
jgi:hypothetical protein